MFVFHKKLFISHTKVSFKEPEMDFSKYKILTQKNKLHFFNAALCLCYTWGHSYECTFNKLFPQTNFHTSQFYFGCVHNFTLHTQEQNPKATRLRMMLMVVLCATSCSGCSLTHVSWPILSISEAPPGLMVFSPSVGLKRDQHDDQTHVSGCCRAGRQSHDPDRLRFSFKTASFHGKTCHGMRKITAVCLSELFRFLVELEVSLLQHAYVWRFTGAPCDAWTRVLPLL